MNDKVRETLRSIDEMLYVQETDSATNQEIRDKHISGVWCESLRCGKCYGPDKWIADAPPSTNPDTISSSLVVGEPTDEMVEGLTSENLAKALWETQTLRSSHLPEKWDDLDEFQKNMSISSARVVVAALAVERKGEG